MASNQTVNVTGYYTTGFNAINVPDSPATLATAASSTKTFPAMDIISIKYLTAIKIKIQSYLDNPDVQVEGLDYLKLQKNNSVAYYSVYGYEFTSNDTCVLSVAYDPWLTNGGIDLLNVSESQSGVVSNILDGMTVRHHVPKNKDTFGLYCEDDDLLINSEPLKTVHGGSGYARYSDDKILYCDGDTGIFFDATRTGPSSYNYNSASLIRSSLELYEMANDQNIQYLIKDVDISGTKFCSIVPEVIPGPSHYTKYKLNNGFVKTHSSMPAVSDTQMADPAYETIFKDTPEVKQGIAVARSMGVENSISASYSIPMNFMSDLPISDGKVIVLSGIFYSMDLGAGMGANNPYRFTYASSVTDPDDQSSYTINNKRVLYGKHNKYCITAAATGEHTEALPEECVNNDNATSGGYSGPIAAVSTDPRPSGKPYFNFLRLKYGGIKSNSSTDQTNILNFYDKSCSGMQWQENPIQYTTISNQERTLASQQMKIAYEAFQGSYVGRTLNAGGIGNYTGINAGNATAMVAGSYGMGYGTNSSGDETFSAGSISGVAGTAQTGLSHGAYGFVSNIDNIFGTNIKDSTTFSALNKEAAADKVAKIQRAFEIGQFNLSTSIPVSDVAFPYEDSMRDALGNGCFIYRYRPTDRDLIKFDKILNMYGYRINEPLKKEHFTNRSKFNYIQAVGVSFGTKVKNMTDRDMLASLFSGGVRIWHVRPNANFYKGTANS